MTFAFRELPPLARRAGTIGIMALCVCAIGAVFDATAFFEGWLVSWLFLVGIALAAMMDVMIHVLTGGRWGLVLRRPLEAAMASLPLVALFALPLAFGLPHLFAWARPEAAGNELLRAKQWYLNPSSFIGRNAAILVVWISFSIALRRVLAIGAPASRQARRIAVAGLIVYLFTVTIVAFDWVASLEPTWYSTAIGIRVGVGQFVAAFGFAVPFAVFLAHEHPATREATPRDFQDLGNLLLTFSMTWAYIAFMQYLIVWAEDLPHEIAWYWPRTQTTWLALVAPIVTMNFAIPVVAMLFRGIKRSGFALATVCALALIGQWLDVLWLTMPSVRPAGFEVRWLDIAALVAQGGLWIAAVVTITERLPAPRRSPRDEEAAYG
ncbi:MAG TPA: hypothetical protein VGN65_13050 [Casimicrobiaceae bacterium]